jgi:hypothetical protein
MKKPAIVDCADRLSAFLARHPSRTNREDLAVRAAFLQGYVAALLWSDEDRGDVAVEQGDAVHGAGTVADAAALERPVEQHADERAALAALGRDDDGDFLDGSDPAPGEQALERDPHAALDDGHADT